jgi:chromosomal replication initiation ATPase DnaA
VNIAEHKLATVRRCHRDFIRAADSYMEFIESRSVATESNRRPKVRLIQETIADHYQLHIACMTSKDRPANFVKARQVAIAICRMLTKYSQAEIGECFGGRDHGTILLAIRSTADRIKVERGFKREFDELLAICTQRLDDIDLPIFNIKAP